MGNIRFQTPKYCSMVLVVFLWDSLRSSISRESDVSTRMYGGMYKVTFFPNGYIYIYITIWQFGVKFVCTIIGA